MILTKMDNKFDTFSNYRILRLPGSLSLDINDIKTNHNNLSITTSTMSPSQINTSINSTQQDAGKLLLDACRIGDLNEVKNLVDNGAPLSADWLGTSPLHLASQYGHTETAEILLKAGASRDTRTKVDRTPLHVAALEGHLPIVNLLLNNGAEVDAKDLLKMTPLHWAVERGHYDVVEYLLAHGADVNLLSKFDKTPIDIAYDNGRTDMIPLLEKFVHNTSRPKANNQVIAIQNIKQRPTILPNKSNRAHKQLVTTTNNNKTPTSDNSISSTNNKSFTIENIKKLMSNNSINVKKESSSPLSATSSPNKITTRSSSQSLNDTKEAIQWLEKNGIASSSTNGKDSQDDQLSTSNSTNKPTKNNIITIAVNQNLNQLIKNSQSAPFVIINSNDLDGNKKKVIKLDKVTTNNNKNTSVTMVDSSDLDDLDLTQNERLKQEIQSVKSENKILKDEVKSIKMENATLKKELERKDKIIDDFKKRFN